jgi:hypothetical protein
MRDLRNLPDLPLGLRYNNPGNIRPGTKPWIGQAGIVNTPNGKFVEFESLEYGIRAMLKDIMNKYNSGLTTLSAIINKWAPPSDNNNTSAYIKFVSDLTGIAPNENIANFGARLPYIVLSMIYVEQGKGKASQYISDEDIHEALKLLSVKVTPKKAIVGAGMIVFIIFGIITFFYVSKK